MQEKELEAFLRGRIPLSAAMAVEVRAASPSAVVIFAPLAPNLNHRDTAFGGSVSAVAILAAWSVLYVRMQAEGLAGRIVIGRNSMSYDQPIAGDFTATAAAPDTAGWARFRATLARNRTARIRVNAWIESQANAPASWKANSRCCRHDPTTRARANERRCGADGQLDLKPAFLWLPSQNGLFADAPQRQRYVSVTRVTVRPVPLTISSGPVTLSGPSVAGTTFTAPLRTASGCDSFVAGSPVAAKPAFAWLPSQYGLLDDVLHWHRAARNPAGSPLTCSGACSANGPFSRTCTPL